MKKSAPLQPLALSAADVGRLLGVSAKTVYEWDSSGRLGPMATRFSERVTRWNAEEVREWFIACQRERRPIRRQEWLAMGGRA